MTRYDDLLELISVDTDDCILWPYASHDKGYGRIWIGGKTVATHRVSYEYVNGAIPDSMVLDHFKCYEPSCINPKHLIPATVQQNGWNRKGPMKRTTSGHRGVSWISRDKAWGIHAKRFDKKFHGGNYADLAEAVAAVEELRMYLQSKTREEIGRMKSGRIYL